MTDLPRRVPEPEGMDDPEEARAYAAADFGGVNQAFVDRLLEFVGPMPVADAVDLGAGPGDIVLRLLRARPDWRITAVDVSPAMLVLARRAAEDANLAAWVAFVRGDAANLPQPDGSFDVIFSNSLLHHVASPRRLWMKVSRLGRPGAAVFFRDLIRPPTTQAARDLVRLHAGGESHLLQEEFYRSFLSAYTLKEVREQLAEAGLSGLRVEQVTDRHLDIFGRAG